MRRYTHKTNSCIHVHILQLHVLTLLLDSQIVSVLANYKLQQNNPLKYSGRLGSGRSEVFFLRELIHYCAWSEKKPSTLLSNISRP